jgi:hypothetical protein
MAKRQRASAPIQVYPVMERGNDASSLEALGEFDHGLSEPMGAYGSEKEKIPPQSIKEHLLQAVRVADMAALNLLHKGANALRLDQHTKEEVARHTEEEVAGAKLCVKETVRQDSFNAPT